MWLEKAEFPSSCLLDGTICKLHRTSRPRTGDGVEAAVDGVGASAFSKWIQGKCGRNLPSPNQNQQVSSCPHTSPLLTVPVLQFKKRSSNPKTLRLNLPCMQKLVPNRKITISVPSLFILIDKTSLWFSLSHGPLYVMCDASPPRSLPASHTIQINLHCIYISYIYMFVTLFTSK